MNENYHKSLRLKILHAGVAPNGSSRKLELVDFIILIFPSPPRTRGRQLGGGQISVRQEFRLSGGAPRSSHSRVDEGQILSFGSMIPGGARSGPLVDDGVRGAHTSANYSR